MVQPIQTAGALTSLRGGKARGKRSKGKNYIWNDTPFRRTAYSNARKMLAATAAKAANVAKNGMQDLGGAHAPSGQYPAIQSENLQDAIDSELFWENRRWMSARFGVYGDVASRSQSDFSSDYDDDTPVGQYAYTLATGAGRDGIWPWVTLTIKEVVDDGWVDAEYVGARMQQTEANPAVWRKIQTLRLL